MTRLFVLTSSLLTAAVVSTACGFEHSGSSLAPTPTPTALASLYVGDWVSSSPAGVPPPNTCGDFEWWVATQTSSMIAGRFAARCAGNLNVSGSTWGDLKGTTVTFTTTAGAVGPGVTVCDVSMTGTATLDGDTLRMPYSGSTCLGPITGTETLRRR